MNPTTRNLGLLSPPGFGRGDDEQACAMDVDGHFSADSMIRRIHRERLIAFSGVRALLMQACDPLAVVGFKRHSVIFDDPQKRLQSTDERMSRMYFGSEALARRTGAEIGEMLDRVSAQGDKGALWVWLGPGT